MDDHEEPPSPSPVPVPENEAGGTIRMSVDDIVQAAVRTIFVSEQYRNQTETTRVENTPFSNNEISTLLPTFDGPSQNIELWLERVDAVQRVYRVPDSVMQLLAVGKLTGKAKEWYLSKVEFILMDWNTFKSELRKMYGIRQNVVALRKNFEKRRWRAGERFADYYHDKVRLGNLAGIPENELILYLVDGFDNKTLQNQARMMLGQFGSSEDLFNIMMTVANDNSTVSVNRHVSVTSSSGASGTGPSSGRTTTTHGAPSVVGSRTAAMRGRGNTRLIGRCFNCFREGHRASDCDKPARARGSCFSCGEMGHLIQDCPRRPQPSGAADSTTNIVQTPNLEKPYMVEVEYELTLQGGIQKYALSALIDSGSAVSLIKSNFVPKELVLKPILSNEFRGINGSLINVLGTFSTKILVNSKHPTDVNFMVVPQETMTYPVLLGRDFIACKKILFDEGKLEFISDDYINYVETVNEIMNIEYVEQPFLCSEELKINPKVDLKVQRCLTNMYNQYVHSRETCEKLESKVEMSIKVKNSNPVRYRPRRLAYFEKLKLQEILDDFMKQGIIRPSNSPYASPIVLIRKRSGDIRLCVDYRELNKVIVRDNFPTPLIDDHLDRLKGKKFFTKLDLKNGFYHVKINESSVPYTAFVTPLGQFEFLKMPMGLSNSPNVFARFTFDVFHELISQGKLLVYFDDILIASTDLDEHLNILSQVFEIAAKYGLQFRLDKCSFLENSATYLGYVITEEGISPSPENIESVINFPIPQTCKEVHRFVSLASFFRRFIKDFAVIARPLYSLCRKNAEFQFGNKEFDSFHNLKRCLVAPPVLAIFDPKLETELHCDASSSGFGAVLLQKQSTGLFQPVAYFSHKTTPVEEKYHSFELECLATIYAIKRFHIYLYGIKFTLITDCDSFRLALKKKDINPRIARWALFLENYNYEIQHRSGKKMGHVDALSRCHSILTVESISLEQTLAIKQSQDPDIVNIRDKLEKTEDKLFELRDGIVYRKEGRKLLFYVPKSMRENIIRLCHDEYGHAGLDKVSEILTRNYWFPNVRGEVRNYIDNCLKCIVYSPMSGKTEGFLHPIPKGNMPFEIIHVDHYGPLEKAKKTQNRYVFEIIDAFTKHVRLYACRTTNSNEVIKHLKDYFRSYSCPNALVADRGSAFTSDAFKSFLIESGVRLILVARGTPRANGQIERINRSLTPMLSKLSRDLTSWDTVLPQIEFALNNTICRSTQNTPCMLLFGKNQRGEVYNDLSEFLESDKSQDELIRDLTALRDEAAQNIEKSQLTNKAYYDKHHKIPHVYNQGDFVMIRNVDVTPGINKKLLPKFKGPYVVTKVLDNDRYVVEDVDGFQLSQRPFSSVVGPDQMKLWLR